MAPEIVAALPADRLMIEKRLPLHESGSPQREEKTLPPTLIYICEAGALLQGV
jgi:hypothetical protein